MNKARRLALKAVDFIEVTVPALLFLVIFVVFLIAIVSRYLLRQPVPWTYEISILAFLWCAYFACGYAMKTDDHVVFALVYDMLTPKAQRLCRLLSHVLIAATVLVSLGPCLDSLSKNRGFTGTLLISFKYAFFPLIIMFVDILLRSVYGLVQELRGKNTAQPRQEEPTV